MLKRDENNHLEPDNSSGHIRWVDSLRGFAAIWVVLLHFDTKAGLPESLFSKFTGAGGYGVTIFFVVSGFSIQLSAQRSASMGRFASKRFWRIYPPYIFSLLIVCVAIVIRWAITGTNDIASLSPMKVAALSSMVTWPMLPFPNINWVYWTLGFELAFYVVSGVANFRKRFTGYALALVTIVAIGYGPTPPGGPLLSPTASPFSFLNAWSFFAVGAALALRSSGPRNSALALMSLCALDWILNREWVEVGIALATTFSIWLCMTDAGKFLNKDRLFSKVGLWSYSLYLLHVPVGVWSIMWLVGKTRTSTMGHFIVDLLVLCVCCAVAQLSYNWVEIPWQKFGNTLTNAIVRRRTSA